MKTVTVKIDLYNGGMSDDVREQANGVFSITRNFDIFTNKRRLTPYRDTIANDTVSATSSTMTEFLAKNFAFVNSTIYALCRTSSSLQKLRLLEKTDPVGANSNWALSASATQSSNGIPLTATFVPFYNYLYGLKNSGAGTSSKADIWKYGDVTGTKALSETVGGADPLTLDDSSLTRGAQGIVGKDDNLYLPYENKLAQITSAGSVTAGVLTIPAEYTITSLALWHNYLAIGCKPKSGIGTSKVFFWDYVSDDVSDVIDWGKGNLLVLENIEDTLIGISDGGGSSTFVINSTTVISQWSGGSVETFHELSYGSLGTFKAKINSKLYFSLSDGTTLGIWVIGRKKSSEPFAVTFDRLLSNDTAVTTLNAFIMIGDYVMASIGTDGNIRRTNEQNTYTATSEYESQKVNAGDLSKVKELKAVALSFAPLPSGAAIYLDYRVNSSSVWTSLFSETTVGAEYHEALREELNNKEFSDGHEFEFRVRSTGKSEPVDLKAIFNVVDSQIEE